MIGTESDIPYMRTPLSKELWFRSQPTSGVEDSASSAGDEAGLNFTDWGGRRRSLYYEPEDFYVEDPDTFAAQEGWVEKRITAQFLRLAHLRSLEQETG